MDDVNSMAEAVDVATVAKAGMGAFLTLASDGSLASLSPDEAFELVNTATADPSAVAGLSPENAGPVDLDAARKAMVAEYCALSFGAVSDELVAEQEAEEQSQAMSDRDAMFVYAGLGPEDVAKIMEDEDLTGDSATLSAARARFYLG